MAPPCALAPPTLVSGAQAQVPDQGLSPLALESPQEVALVPGRLPSLLASPLLGAPGRPRHSEKLQVCGVQPGCGTQPFLLTLPCMVRAAHLARYTTAQAPPEPGACAQPRALHIPAVPSIRTSPSSCTQAGMGLLEAAAEVWAAVGDFLVLPGDVFPLKAHSRSRVQQAPGRSHPSWLDMASWWSWVDSCWLCSGH